MSLPTTTSRYTQTDLNKGAQYDLLEVAELTGYNRELTKIAFDEITAIGAYGALKSAQFTQACGTLSLNLAESGHRTEVFKNTIDNLQQVTDQNLVTMANLAQQSVLKTMMRSLR
jgi:hypothetical protein